jgi:hypothetical protein
MSNKQVPVYDDKAEIRDTLDLTDAEWIRAGEGEGEHVEVAFVEHTDGNTYIAMRNSAQPDGPVLVFTESEWEAFIEGAKDGEFDEPW